MPRGTLAEREAFDKDAPGRRTKLGGNMLSPLGRQQKTGVLKSLANALELAPQDVHTDLMQQGQPLVGHVAFQRLLKERTIKLGQVGSPRRKLLQVPAIVQTARGAVLAFFIGDLKSHGWSPYITPRGKSAC